MIDIDLNATPFRYSDDAPEGFRPGVIRPGDEIGARETSISVYELAPGEAVCPYHYECAEEEWAIPLDGTVTVCTPSGTHELGPMHMTFFRTGPDGAHQLYNASDATIRLLMFGQCSNPGATIYPDTGKVAVWVEGLEQNMFLQRQSVGYFDGERRVEV